MNKPDRYYYPAVFTYEPGQEIAVVFRIWIVLPAGLMKGMPFYPRVSYWAAFSLD